MAFRVTRHVMGALQKERNDVQLALKKTWKAHQHTDGLVSWPSTIFDPPMLFATGPSTLLLVPLCLVA